jgi:hypothetical protein
MTYLIIMTIRSRGVHSKKITAHSFPGSSEAACGVRIETCIGCITSAGIKQYFKRRNYTTINSLLRRRHSSSTFVFAMSLSIDFSLILIKTVTTTWTNGDVGERML